MSIRSSLSTFALGQSGHLDRLFGISQKMFVIIDETTQYTGIIMQNYTDANNTVLLLIIQQKKCKKTL